MTGDELREKMAQYTVSMHAVAREAGTTAATVSRQISGELRLAENTIAAARRLIQVARRERQIVLGLALLDGVDNAPMEVTH